MNKYLNYYIIHYFIALMDGISFSDAVRSSTPYVLAAKPQPEIHNKVLSYCLR